MIRHRLAALLRQRRGNVTVMMAGGLAMLLGSAALGVDTATLFLEKRRLQGVADAAALAAAADIDNSRIGAEAAIALDPARSSRLVDVTNGRFTPDPALAIDSRFAADATPANAARVALDSRVDPIFARIFGVNGTTVTAHATAARIDLAAFSIGSRLASVHGGLPNALLSQLAGTELALSAMDYTALVSGQVDILRMSELLRTELGLQAVTFGEVVRHDIRLPKLMTAMAGATGNAAAAQALRALAARVPNRAVRLDTIIDLGPLADLTAADPNRPVAADAYTLLRESLLIAGGDRQVRTDVDLSLPGIGSTRLWMEIGERPANSPWLAISAAGRTTVRTAQTRIWLDIGLVAAPLGLATVRVPVFVELAQAHASLASVGCKGGRAGATAALDVTPAIGQVAIADLDPATLGDFQRAAALRPARVLTTPLASVTAFADIALGGTRSQRVSFTAADIDQHLARTVSTNDLTAGVAGSLLRNVDLQARVLGIGLSAGGLTQTVGGILSTAAPAVDLLIGQVTALAGVHVGEADIWVNSVRCGTPMLVG